VSDFGQTTVDFSSSSSDEDKELMHEDEKVETECLL
jgi:hypothetical protein